MTNHTDAANVWELVKDQLRKIVEDWLFESCFTYTRQITFVEGVLHVGMASSFQVMSIMENGKFQDELAAAKKHLAEESRITVNHITFSEDEAMKRLWQEEQEQAQIPETQTAEPKTSQLIKVKTAKSYQITFGDYHVHSGNAEAVRHAEAFADAAKKGLFHIWSNYHGVGTSALAQAMIARIDQKLGKSGFLSQTIMIAEWYQGWKDYWERVMGDDKSKNVAQDIDDNVFNPNGFKVDVLVIEDLDGVSRISDKAKAKLASDIRALVSKGGMVITVSRCPPHAITKIDGYVSSTLLNTATIVKVDPLPTAECLEFIRLTTKLWQHVRIDEEAVCLIADNCRGNLGLLFSLLHQAKTQALTERSIIEQSGDDLWLIPPTAEELTVTVTRKTVKGVLRSHGIDDSSLPSTKKKERVRGRKESVVEIISRLAARTPDAKIDGTEEHRQKKVTMESIQEKVSAHFKIPVADKNNYRSLTGKSREKKYSYPRRLAMYLCRTLINPQPSWEDIGRKFHRDHSTVITAYCKVADNLAKSPKEGLILQQLKDKILGL